VIDGSVEALNYLRTQGKQVTFLTNNSTKSRQEYVEKFTNYGIEATIENICCSASSAARYLARDNASHVLVIGSQGLIEEIELLGDDVKATGVDEIQFTHQLDVTPADFAKVELPSFSHVVIGLDTQFTYAKLCVASLAIQQGAKFISTNKDAALRTACINDGKRYMPGNGSLIAAVEKATGIQSVNTGKPSEHILETLQESLVSEDSDAKFELEKTVMVGDRLDTDILFGQTFGLTTCLVLTGVTTPEVAKVSKIQPSFILPSIKHLMVPDLIQLNKNSGIKS